MKIQGAEALLTITKIKTKKERVKKGYRLPTLDNKIRKQRTRSETRILERTNKIIPTPKIFLKDESNFIIEMETIPGLKLSNHLNSLKNRIKIAHKIGEQVAKLHDNNIIHGDLTTSNMILSNKDKKIYFIDFGLSFISNKIEDKAVDLHLLRQALEAKHFIHLHDLFTAVKKGYEKSKNYGEVFKRFEKVERRGRYKNQI